MSSTPYNRPAALTLFNDFSVGSVQICTAHRIGMHLYRGDSSASWLCNICKVGTFGFLGIRLGQTRAGNSRRYVCKRERGHPTARKVVVALNVPSLYGMAETGLYLHHGQAKTLDEPFGYK